MVVSRKHSPAASLKRRLALQVSLREKLFCAVGDAVMRRAALRPKSASPFDRMTPTCERHACTSGTHAVATIRTEPIARRVPSTVSLAPRVNSS